MSGEHKVIPLSGLLTEGVEIKRNVKLCLESDDCWQIKIRDQAPQTLTDEQYYMTLVLLEHPYPEIRAKLYRVFGPSIDGLLFWTVKGALRSRSAGWVELATEWIPFLSRDNFDTIRSLAEELTRDKVLPQKTRHGLRKVIRQYERFVP